MSGKKPHIFSAEQKAKVALEAIRGIKTVNEIGQEYGVHPTPGWAQWKKERQAEAAILFEGKRGPKLQIIKPIQNACTLKLGD